MVRAIPVALAAAHAPRVLVSATYHIAALTHPEPVVAWSAVAVNVALSRFLQGKRDFVPDVIEALRGNDVPDELLTMARRVPIPERAVSGTVGRVPGRCLDDVEVALRLAYHEPVLERGLVALVEGGPAAAGRAGLAGALLGARDGGAALPDWLPPDERAILSALAESVTPGHHPAESRARPAPSSW